MKSKRTGSKPLRNALADPTKVKPFTRKPEENTSGTARPGDKLLQVIIETPRGSHNKFAFDEEQKIFILKSALPAGMVFPYDFGFVPQTLADDGDPIDVLVLMDSPAFPGCAVMARLIGVIEGEQQTPKSRPVRNDRLVAVVDTTHTYSNLTSIKDMPKQALHELEEFFVNYHRLEGKRYKLLGRKGEKTALKLIEKARKKARA